MATKMGHRLDVKDRTTRESAGNTYAGTRLHFAHAFCDTISETGVHRCCTRCQRCVLHLWAMWIHA